MYRGEPPTALGCHQGLFQIHGAALRVRGSRESKFFTLAITQEKATPVCASLTLKASAEDWLAAGLAKLTAPEGAPFPKTNVWLGVEEPALAVVEVTAVPNADGLAGEKAKPAKGLDVSLAVAVAVAGGGVADATADATADGLVTLMLLSFSLNWGLDLAASFSSCAASPCFTMGAEEKVNPPKVALPPVACEVAVVNEVALLWEAGLPPKTGVPGEEVTALLWGDRTAAGVDTTT